MPSSAQWTFVLCDGSGNTLASLTRASGTSLTFTRNGVPECTFSLSHDDDECATLLTALKLGAGGGGPTLKGYRTDVNGNPILRFYGYLAGISEESGVDASTATFTFRGPFGRILGDGTNRGRTMFAAINYTATDAGQIAANLLVQAQTSWILGTTQIAGSVGILTGTIEATKPRDRQYPVGQNFGEAIVNLTNVLDGFDFEVAPFDGSTVVGTFNVYASMGSSKPAAKFEYGPNTLANCSAVHREVLPPANLVNIVGIGGLSLQVFNPDSISRYGRRDYFIAPPDASDFTTLNDKGQALLRPNPVKTIDFTPESRLAPSPWDDYWIGDTVYFYANRGALVEGPIGVRVNSITVAIDPDTGLEVSEIPNPETPDEAATIRASLSTEVV